MRLPENLPWIGFSAAAILLAAASVYAVVPPNCEENPGDPQCACFVDPMGPGCSSGGSGGGTGGPGIPSFQPPTTSLGQSPGGSADPACRVVRKSYQNGSPTMAIHGCVIPDGDRPTKNWSFILSSSTYPGRNGLVSIGSVNDYMDADTAFNMVAAPEGSLCTCSGNGYFDGFWLCDSRCMPAPATASAPAADVPAAGSSRALYEAKKYCRGILPVKKRTSIYQQTPTADVITAMVQFKSGSSVGCRGHFVQYFNVGGSHLGWEGCAPTKKPGVICTIADGNPPIRCPGNPSSQGGYTVSDVAGCSSF